MKFNLGLYDSAEIAGVIDNNPAERLLFLETFGMEHFSEGKQIIFDMIAKDVRLAPFVSPGASGKAGVTRGNAAKSFLPAYIKIKDVIEFEKTTTRRVGEALGGTLTPAQRFEIAMLSLAQHQDLRIGRTMEVMARDIYRTGKYVVSGEDYPTQTIDFDRHTDNTIVNTGTADWSHADASPVKQLKEILLKAKSKFGRIIIGAGAMGLLTADPLFKDLLDTRFRGNSTDVNMDFAQMEDDQTILHGYIGASKIPLFTTNNTYEVEVKSVDGIEFVEKRYVEDNEVVFIPARSKGYRCYGIIQDMNAGFASMARFFRVWADNDPAIPQCMTQSAPLLAHTDINSTYHLTAYVDAEAYVPA